ncbi:unnamed protein product [Musa acuminata subsp. burmannicoides]
MTEVTNRTKSEREQPQRRRPIGKPDIGKKKIENPKTSKLLSSGEEQKVKPSEADSPMQHLLPGRSSPPSSPNRSGRGANKNDDVGSMLGSVPSPGVGH